MENVIDRKKVLDDSILTILVNKSFLTNLMAISLIIVGNFTPLYKKEILSVGYFAFSGAITNWLAIHMLFEKVPFLYGSGIVPNRFEDFKIGIKKLIMNQFFTSDNINSFLNKNTSEKAKHIDSKKLISKINFDKIFQDLLVSINESSFGGMLAMFGGIQALEPLKEPIISKMKVSISEIIEGEEFQNYIKNELANSDLSSSIIKDIDQIVTSRLDELTPKMVKEIIQEMIREHLGWLVVWGGIFGGIIGLVMSLTT